MTPAHYKIRQWQRVNAGAGRSCTGKCDRGNTTKCR